MKKPRKRDVVIYDSDCGICEKFRYTIEKLDWLKRIQFKALQEQSVYIRFSHLTKNSCKKEIKFISTDGETFGGGEAITQLFFKIIMLAPIAILFSSPPFNTFVRLAYTKVAKNRFLISSSCSLK